MKYRVLVATPFLSNKPLRGYETIAYAIIQDLNNMGHHVDLLTFDSDGRRKFDYKSFEKIINKFLIIKISFIQRVLNLILGIIKGETLQVSYFKGNFESEKSTKNSIREENYDLFISITIRMSRFSCGYKSNAFKVLHLVDPHILNYKKSSVWENVLIKIIYKIDYFRLLRFEKKTLPEFHIRTLISDEDINEMSSIYGLKFDKLTYGTTNVIYEYNFLNFEKRDKNKLVITGNMAYKPNVLGVEWFCTKIFPVLLKHHPSIKLFVIGSNPPQRLLKFKSSNIFFTGFVENLKEFMSNAIVSICPVKHRIGVQTKILEAFALKLPVISTTNGNSGINAINFKEILIADTPEEFLIQYEFLLVKNNWDTLSNNSFDKFENNFILKNNINVSNNYIFKKMQS